MNSLVNSYDPVQPLVEGDGKLEVPLDSTTPAGTPPPTIDEDQDETTVSAPHLQAAPEPAEVQQPTPPAEGEPRVDYLEDATGLDIGFEGLPVTVSEPATPIDEDQESSDDDSDDSLIVSSALLGSRNETPLVAEDMATLDIEKTPPFTPFVHTPASEAVEGQDGQELAEEDGFDPEEEMGVETIERDDLLHSPAKNASPPSDDDSESEDELNLLPLPHRSNEAVSPLSVTTPLAAPSPRRTSTRLRPTPSQEALGEAESSSQPRRSTRGRRAPTVDNSQTETSQIEETEASTAPDSIRRSTRLGGAAEEPTAATWTSPFKPKGKRARPSETPAAVSSPSASASKRHRGQDPSGSAEDEAPARPLARQHTHSDSTVLRQDPSPSTFNSTSTPHLPITRSHCELHKLEFSSNIMRSPYHVAMPSVSAF